MFIAAQAVGFIALTMAIISFQQNTRRGILSFQIISGVIFAVHFMMLGAYTGAVMNLITVLRNIVFIYQDKPWAKGRVWLFAFALLSIAAGVFTWKGFYTLLPVGGLLFCTFSFWLKNPKYVRLFSFPSSPLWLIYNIITGSIAGVVTESFVMCSIIVGMLRFDRKSKEEKSKSLQ